MSRRTVGALLVLASALVYSVDWAAHHIGAMVFVAGKTGDMNEQYRFAASLGDGSLLPIAIGAFLLGVLYLAWAELRPAGA